MIVTKLGHEPTADEIADVTGIEPEEVDSIKRFARAPISLEKPMGDEEESELGQFIEQSKPYASGWLGFYWGQTPEQLRESSEPGAVLMRSWLELFQKMRAAIVG